MSNSSLIRSTILSPNHSGRRTHPISKIAIHIMAGNLTAENCGYWFRNPAAQASSNYGIGTDGGVCLYVDEANRSWCTSSGWVDNRAVTIEVANDGRAPNWHVSDKAYQSVLNLVEDICRRNGIKECTYTGNSNGTLIKHSWYANKSCPGPYLGGKFPDIAKIVTSRLKGGNGATQADAKPINPPKQEVKQPTNTTNSKAPYLVSVTANVLNYRSGAGTSHKINGTVKKNEVYTIVEEKDGWGKLKSGAGWISLAYTKKTTAKKVDIDKLAREVLAGKWGNGTDRKNKLTAAGYDYNAIQAIVNGKFTKPIAVGDMVTITASNYYTGQTIPPWVKSKKHEVSQISGDKVLLGFPNGICSWVAKSGVVK